MFVGFLAVALNFYHTKACDEYRWAAYLFWVCVRFTAIFLIYLISFLLHYLSFVGGRKMEIFIVEVSITNRENAGKLLCSISSVCLVKKRTQSENWQRRERERNWEREKQKDIKLKVVKTSSRFSIYFQLHFAFLLGVFRKCVSVSSFSPFFAFPQ